jgi:16S rRNA (guanine527-N7)-methyltransferase
MIDFRKAVKSVAGISLNPAQLRAFETYSGLLLEWNRRFNLTAITDPNEIQTKHFLDSLSCLKAMSLSAGMRVIDVGTGAGFPGIPLEIAFPEIQLTLVEANGKKAEFCRFLADKLQLDNVTILHARVEGVGRDPLQRETYDWALARAVASLPILAEYLLPLLKLGGHALVQKGENGPAEVQSAAKAIQILGGEFEKMGSVELPGIVEKRFLILLKKQNATPANYPRRAGIPSKRPLG